MSEYGEWKLWTNGVDTFVALSAEDAAQKSRDHYGGDDDQPGDFELVDPAKSIRIWQGSPGENEETKTAAEWVACSEPGLLCSTEW